MRWSYVWSQPAATRGWHRSTPAAVAPPTGAGTMRRRAAGRAALAFAVALALTGPPSLAATVQRGPYLQTGTPTSVIVKWRTDVATSGRVMYGTQPSSLTSTA